MDRTPPPPEIAPRAQRSLTWGSRALLLYAGVVLPVICFLLAVPIGFPGEWQSGNLHEMLGFLLAPPAALPIYPFLLYPITCLTLVLIHESHARHFLVRFGIYSAVLPAMLYGIVLHITVGEVAKLTLASVGGLLLSGVIAVILGLVAFALLRWGLPLLGRQVRQLPRLVQHQVRPVVLVVALAVLILVGVGVFVGPQRLTDLMEISSAILIFSNLAAAPFWALTVYAAMGLRIYRRQPGARQFSLAQLVGVLSWFSAHLAAWRWGWRLAMIEYAQLPTQQPNGCYVVTAAARGHRWWVGADRSPGADGAFRANNQLRYLKAAELALAVAAPHGHRRLRRWYDQLGPPTAARLHHPLAADVAYTLLKPAEWTARLLLKVTLPDFERLAGRLYRDPGSGMRDERFEMG
nr:hypothetical protein [Planctomycetales bacterium]